MRFIYTVICCLVLQLGMVHVVQAMTVQDLLQQNKLQIKAWIEPSSENLDGTLKSLDIIGSEFAPRQQVDLYIQVKTDRWFAAGTYISPFSVDNSLVLQRNKLANNYAQREKGITWSIQEWQLTLYPQLSGEYIVPAIPVSVSIASAPGEKVTGHILTTPLSFNVALPDARLSEDVNWVAAPELTFSQEWNIEVNSELKVGDAITRTVTIAGRDTSIMLLPDFTPFQSDRVQSYRDKDNAQDSQNRDGFYASKTIIHTYIIQKNGQLDLPALSLLWWNTETQTLQPLTVSGGQWSVQHTPASFVRAYRIWILSCLIIGGLVIYTAYRLWQQYQHAKLPYWLMFIVNVYRQQWPLCTRDLYNQHYKYSGNTQLRQPGSRGSYRADPAFKPQGSQPNSGSSEGNCKGHHEGDSTGQLIAAWSEWQYGARSRWQSHSIKQQRLFLALWLAIRKK
ncbi:hypothetical protein FMO003_32750 [Moritella sp. F3]|nr:hypothetical protein FMO001_09440 [Moritella sp. F1]GIC82995.1 hypothetical protein FMO003_32750 [Moritella sp. F3]